MRDKEGSSNRDTCFQRYPDRIPQPKTTSVATAADAPEPSRHFDESLEMEDANTGYARGSASRKSRSCATVKDNAKWVVAGSLVVTSLLGLGVYGGFRAYYRFHPDERPDGWPVD